MFEKLYNAIINLGRADIGLDIVSNGDVCTVRSNGLERRSLQEVEISSCPMRLKDVASNLILQVARNALDTPESLKEGKTIGGRYVQKNQPMLEVFYFLRSADNSAVLRIADLDDKCGAFPYRLIATHLCATAGASRQEQLRLLLVSIEVWPMEKVASNALLGDYELNPNNFWSWIDLGTVLSQSGKITEAIEQWTIAACMWPRGGKLYASRMINGELQKSRNRSSNKAVHDFWLSVTNEAIKKWCQDLDVDLTDAALGD